MNEPAASSFPEYVWSSMPSAKVPTAPGTSVVVSGKATPVSGPGGKVVTNPADFNDRPMRCR